MPLFTHSDSGYHRQTFWMLCRMVVLIFAADGLPAQTPEVNTEATKTAERYGATSAPQFAQRTEANQEIEAQHFDADLLSAAIFHRTNAVRSQYNLATLAYNADATHAAQKHSNAMASGGFLSHETPNPKKNISPLERLKAEGLKPQFSAENIAFGFLLRYRAGQPFFTRLENGSTVYSYEPNGVIIQRHTYASFAEAIVQQWMDSPGHRRNLLSSEPNQLGVGAALAPGKNSFDKIYCVQNFFAPFPSAL